MIAGEEKPLSVEQKHVAARVPRSWYGDQILVKLNFLLTLDYLLNSKSSSAIVRMHHTFAAKPPGKQFVVSNVIAVCQEHPLDTTHCIDPFYKLRGKSRRINKYIAAFVLRTHNQIAPGAETRFRSEPAEVHILVNKGRKRLDANMPVVLLGCSN